MKFALIGGGVVGRCYAQALVESGLTLSGIWDIAPTEALKDFAANHGTTLHSAPEGWLADADYVVSAVFGTVSLEVAEKTLPFMKAGAVYIDMTTSTPEHKAEAAEQAEKQGLNFIDIAITGAVNMRGAKTPLLCAGQNPELVTSLFSSIGTPIKTVDGPAGNAARLKLLRSIFAKGLEALTVECLSTAEANGLRAQLHEILLDIDQTPLQAFMEALVTTHIQHAARRRNEVKEAQQLMRESGIEPIVLAAVESLFDRTVNTLEHDKAPEDTPDAALKWLVRSAANAPQAS